MKKIILSTVALASICLGADTKSLPDISNTEAWKGLTYLQVGSAQGFEDNEQGIGFGIGGDKEEKEHIFKNFTNKSDYEKSYLTFEKVCNANGGTFRNFDEDELVVTKKSRMYGNRLDKNRGIINSELDKDVICEDENKKIVFLVGVRKLDTKIILDVTKPIGMVQLDLEFELSRYKKRKAKEEKALTMTAKDFREQADAVKNEKARVYKEACDNTLAYIKKRINNVSSLGETTMELKLKDASQETSEARSIFKFDDSLMMYKTNCPIETIKSSLEAEGYKFEYSKAFMKYTTRISW